MTGIEARSSSMPNGAKRGCIDQAGEAAVGLAWTFHCEPSETSC